MSTNEYLATTKIHGTLFRGKNTTPPYPPPTHPKKKTCLLKRDHFQKEKIVFQSHHFSHLPQVARMYQLELCLFCTSQSCSTAFPSPRNSKTTHSEEKEFHEKEGCLNQVIVLKHQFLLHLHPLKFDATLGGG